jgi:hypothetical protein
MTCHANSEDRFVALCRGKWSQAGVPHRGWICVEIEDLGKPQKKCEMCESQTIRYVHHMEHPDYAEILAVGCVCAGHMEGDLVGARVRDSAMQSRAGKRKRWVTRKWRISANGNPCIRADGFRVTVYKRRNGWRATVSAEDNSLVRHSRKAYQSVNRAKLAAFDFITHVLSKRPG